MEEQRKFKIANEIRFYVLFALSAFLLIKGFYEPPVGVIEKSVMWVSAGLTTLGACMVGVDIKGIIRELRMWSQQNKDFIDRHIKDNQSTVYKEDNSNE